MRDKVGLFLVLRKYVRLILFYTCYRGVSYGSYEQGGFANNLLINMTKYSLLTDK